MYTFVSVQFCNSQYCKMEKRVTTWGAALTLTRVSCLRCTVLLLVSYLFAPENGFVCCFKANNDIFVVVCRLWLVSFAICYNSRWAAILSSGTHIHCRLFIINLYILPICSIWFTDLAVWNGIACLQLIACRDRTAGVVVPTSITNSYAKIAFCGLGWIGVGITDASVFITLFGVCVSTLVNCAALLQDIFGTFIHVICLFVNTVFMLARRTRVVGDHLSLNSYIALTAVCTYPLTCLKNMSMLARLSPLGIVCLALNVATIVGYGVSLYWNELTGIEVPMWPQNPPALASYTGIAIFCFGVCTMVLQVEESMEDAATFPSALLRCLVIVCAVYFFVGDIVALLYSHDSRGVFGNILLNLPRDAVISTLSRLAMIAVGVHGGDLLLCETAVIINLIFFWISCFSSVLVVLRPVPTTGISSTSQYL